jgi:UDP-GlcNAc:undecaprenyl-phosphate/decaprenyl-phosphate GlcNAc-1-phosphate transferase
MDGVAVGLAAITAAGYFSISIATHETRVALLAVVVCGACVGFLPFNYSLRADRGASIFLGDAGTLSLGFVLAALPLALDLPGSSPGTRVAVPGLLLGVPLFNLALVMVSRRRGGRPVMSGGTDGVAHRLVVLGSTRERATLLFWAAGTALAAVGILVARASAITGWIAFSAAAVTFAAGIWAFERVELSSGEPAGTGAEQGDLVTLPEAADVTATRADNASTITLPEPAPRR